MEPTIETGDRILVNLIAYDFKIPFSTWTLAQWGTPTRGDVVVFRTENRFHSMVKRVIGLTGETVEIRQGIVYINGQAATYQNSTKSERFRNTLNASG